MRCVFPMLGSVGGALAEGVGTGWNRFAAGV